MSLVPFFEGLAKVASATGLPIWHGLMLDFPEDPACWPITDEVTVGGAVLLAPIMKAGATSRSVYLPEGRWDPWAGGGGFQRGAPGRSPAAPGGIPGFPPPRAGVPAFSDG